MKLATNKRAVSMIIGTLIAVIITAIFIYAVGQFVYDTLGGVPSVSGAIIDPTKVICFGGGKDNSIHCLEKTTGEELFSFEKARKWKGSADSNPVLTKEGIFLAVGDHFCAYDSTRRSLLSEDCKSYSHRISDLTANEKYVCFSAGTGYHCIFKETGTSLPTFGEAKEVEYISIDENSAYFMTGGVLEVDIIVGKDIEFAGRKIGVKMEKFLARLFGIYVVIDGEDHELFAGDKYPLSDITVKVLDIDADHNKATLRITTNKNFISKYDFDKGQVVWTEDVAPVSTGITIGNDEICYGATKLDGDGKIKCNNKNTGEFTFEVTDDNKAFSKPAISNDDIYFGLGKIFQKWSISQSKYFSTEFGKVVSTGVALGEDLACFGEGNTLHCFDATAGIELFSLTAPKSWSKREALSMPLISNGIVYLALGDKFCVYDTTKRGVLTEDDATWCKDFDEQITTDIIGYDNE